MILLELEEAMFVAAEAGCDECVLGYRHGMRGRERDWTQDLRINISGYQREWFPYLQSIRFINNPFPSNPISSPKPRQPPGVPPPLTKAIKSSSKPTPNTPKSYTPQ